MLAPRVIWEFPIFRIWLCGLKSTHYAHSTLRPHDMWPWMTAIDDRWGESTAYTHDQHTIYGVAVGATASVVEARSLCRLDPSLTSAFA